MAELQRVLVVGAGSMGGQIAMAAALAGLEAQLVDLDAQALDRTAILLRDRLDRMVQRDKLTVEARDAAFGRLTMGTALATAAASCDVVIEAVVEKLDVKRRLLGELGEACPAEAVITSNSSGFVPSVLADATGRSDKFVNMHFFNPALVMRCVEVVPGPESSEETVAAVVALARRLGKEPVVLDKEIPGFLANRILNAIRDEAVALLEAGVASIEAIDSVCRNALSHPMGPFELQDLTGLDIAYLTKKARYAESGDPADLPSRSLAERVERGDLGRKTGRGWYLYDELS